MSEIGELNAKQLIERFAEVQQISYKEAESLVKGESLEEIQKNIETFTLNKIREKMPPLNRKQRRKLQKKSKKNQEDIVRTVADTAIKLNYIDLIQKLRELNEKKEMENENYEDANEND